MIKRRQMLICLIIVLSVYLVIQLIMKDVYSTPKKVNEVHLFSQLTTQIQANHSFDKIKQIVDIIEQVQANDSVDNNKQIQADDSADTHKQIQANHSVNKINISNIAVKSGFGNVTVNHFQSIILSNTPGCIQRKSGNIVLSNHDLPLTALASPWRSGNTWVRHLLQLATGLGTSALYCDSELRSKGFPFECNHEQYRRMLVVKSHEPNLVRKKSIIIKSPPFERAVLVIRDPYNYIVANLHGGHLDAAKEDDYIRENSKWRKSHPLLLEWWNVLNEYWLKVFKGPVYPLLYSKLLTNTEAELRKLLDFLRVKYTEADIKCATENKEGNFHRKRLVWTRIKDITELFNKTMKMKIESSKTSLSEHLGRTYAIPWLNETHIVRK